jgi:hypothetical protein
MRVIKSQESRHYMPSMNNSINIRRGLRKDPQKGRAAAAPSNIKKIQEIQGGQEAPHDGGAINPKDA